MMTVAMIVYAIGFYSLGLACGIFISGMMMAAKDERE
jgi:hypothetical protein